MSGWMRYTGSSDKNVAVLEAMKFMQSFNHVIFIPSSSALIWTCIITNQGLVHQSTCKATHNIGCYIPIQQF